MICIKWCESLIFHHRGLHFLAIWAATGFGDMLNRCPMTDIATILSYLPPRKIRELEKVTRRIVDTGQAEIVVLFGSYARGHPGEEAL